MAYFAVQLHKSYRAYGGHPCPGFTLVEPLVSFNIIGLLLGLILPAVQQAREAARRAQLAPNLKRFGVAMSAKSAVHNAFLLQPLRPIRLLSILCCHTALKRRK